MGDAQQLVPVELIKDKIFLIRRQKQVGCASRLRTDFCLLETE
jgi:hypothetical protein